MQAEVREKSARQRLSLERELPMLDLPSDMDQRLHAAGFGWGALDRDQDNADEDNEPGTHLFACKPPGLLTCRLLSTI